MITKEEAKFQSEVKHNLTLLSLNLSNPMIQDQIAKTTYEGVSSKKSANYQEAFTQQLLIAIQKHGLTLADGDSSNEQQIGRDSANLAAAKGGQRSGSINL